MTTTSGDIIIEKLAENTACIQRNLLPKELAAALESLTGEHRNLMLALKQSAGARNETMSHRLAEFRSQLLLVIAEVQERINETSRRLSTLENKRRFLRSYGALTVPDTGFRP
ncbi:MAG: hypothetical protein V2B19_21555 [Pseudomonadota bacterium]